MRCPTTRFLEAPTGADSAVLDFLSRRVDAIALSVAAWTPQTAVCSEAHYCLTDALDQLRAVIGLAQQGVATEEGV